VSGRRDPSVAPLSTVAPLSAVAPLPAVPHLVFSTRSPRPESGSDFERVVVAESPGVPPQARGDFARRADLSGSAVRSDETAPLFTFSPLGDERWLFCRAVSLGRYRKGSHQMLVHGLILSPPHLAAVDANPLLFADPSFFPRPLFLDRHPGAGASLPPLDLARHGDADPRRAAAENRQRLAARSRDLEADHDAAFPSLFAALAAGRRAAYAVVQPRPQLVEWLLLHLHPDDRLRVSFHTWYSHAVAVDYRLLLLHPSDAPAVRGQLGGLVVETQRRDTDGGAGDVVGTDGGEEPTAGRLTRQLRRTSADALLAAVRRYRITYLAAGDHPPLSPTDAALCLRAELGEEVGATERRKLADLRLRGGADSLQDAVQQLATVWLHHRDELLQSVARLVASLGAVPAEQVADARRRLRDADPAARWAFLLLLRSEVKSPGLDWSGERAAAWRQLVPADDLGAFLDAVAAPPGEGGGRHEKPDDELHDALRPQDAARVADELRPYVVDAARRRASAEGEPTALDAAAARPGWVPFLLWLTRRGLDAAALLSELEPILERAPEPVAVAWSRRLVDHHLELGDTAAALDLAFRHQLPRLADEPHRRRLRSLVAHLLAAAPGSPPTATRSVFPRGAEALARHLDEPRIASGVLSALADALHAAADPKATARRVEALLAALHRPWPQPAATAAGDLLVALAAGPAGERTAPVLSLLATAASAEPSFAGSALAAAAGALCPRLEAAADGAAAVPLVSAAATLLATRREHPQAADADPALAAVALRGALLADHLDDLAALGVEVEGEGEGEGGAAAASFRAAWIAFLRDVAEAGTWNAVLTEPGWLPLLREDMARRARGDAEADPRYAALLHIAWRRWSEEAAAGGPRPAAVTLLRAARPGASGAGEDWHLRVLRGQVPRQLWPEALELLRLDGPRPDTPFLDTLPVGLETDDSPHRGRREPSRESRR